MKKIAQIILALFVLLIIYQPLTAECSTQKISIKRNGAPVDFPGQMIEKNDRILIPFGFIPLLYDCSAYWYEDNNLIKIQTHQCEIDYLIGSNQAKINGKIKNMDVPAQIVNGLVVVPLAFTLQQLGAIVKWDETNNTILLFDSIFNIYTKDQLFWALATCQIERTINNRNYSLISAPSLPTEEYQKKARENLEIGWGIYSREDALQSIKRLKETGHRKDYEKTVEYVSNLSDTDFQWALINAPYNSPLEKRLKLVKENYKKVGNKSLVAWDFCRLAFVAENAYIVGYITEQEAWDIIIFSAKEIQKTYSSWKDMANNFLMGYQYWNGPHYYLFEKTVNLLLDRSNVDSPWNQYNWDLSLE